MEIMVDPYQSFVDNIFSVSNIRRCETRVFSLQSKLDKAVADNDTKSIRETFNLLAKNSKAVKVLAVYRITQRNKGKYTAGVDGINIPREDQDLQYKKRLVLLKEIDIVRKPDPIRRIFIPKPNGKKRPLGIPTMRDRINQEIIRIAIEPIAEYHFSNNSWGFRPKRSCHDASGSLFNKLSRINSPRYILEGDIKGCFDNINHSHIVNTLLNWKTPEWATKLILKMLKSGIFHNGEIYDSDTGTPQGGVISPLLANVALTSLDNFCFEHYGRTTTTNGKKFEINPIVRYADDFIITCKSKRFAQQVKVEISQMLTEKIGLTLSDEKTNITHITKGFNFLGFNFRKYPKRHAEKKLKSDRTWSDYILLIKPQKEKVLEFLSGCKEVLDNNKSALQSTVIDILNPKLRGWSMYYRHVVSKQLFRKVDYELWNKLFHWSRRRHPSKSNSWVINKYFSKMGTLKCVFKVRENGLWIPKISHIPIKRHVIMNGSYRVYDKSPATQEYWKKREYTNAFKQIHSVRMTNLFKKQDGNCSYCKEPLTKEQISESLVDTHHMLPRSLGGTESYCNLRLLHKECHRELHAKIPRIVMENLWKHGDYLRNLKR